MSLPPPPSQPPGKKKDAPPPKKDDPWDGMLGEKENDGIPPDLARKLLDLNPALREAGEDTMKMVERSQKQADQQAKAKPADKAPASKSTRIVDALADVRATLQRDEKRLGDELKKVTADRAALKTTILDRLYKWLAEHDPDLRSPVTQATLTDEKPFLDKLGFSIKGYMAATKKGAK